MTRPLSYTIEGNDRLSDILERLDKRLDQLDRTMDKVGAGAAGMGRKLDDAERQTKQLGDTADKQESKLDGMSAKLGDMAKNVAGYASAVAAAGAAAAVAVAAAGAAFALEKSKTDALLAGQVGVSGAEAKELGRVAGELYAEGWAESVGEAADAVRSTLQNQLGKLDVAGEPIERLSTRTAALAVMMNEDFDRVTAAVSQMLRNRIVGSAEQAFDLLTAATQQGVNKSQDLLDTMNEYSVQFQELGIDAPKALGLISQALAAGARDSDVAADALKEFAINSKNATDASVRQAYKDLKLDADKMFLAFARGGPGADAAMKEVIQRLKGMEDPVKRNIAVAALFKTKSEDLQKALLAMDPSTAVAALGAVTDASDKFIDSQTSAGQRVEEIWRRTQMAVGDKLLPVIERVLDKLDELGRDTEVQAWLSNIEDALKAFEPLLSGSFEFMETAFGENKEAMLATFGALILGTAAMITAFMQVAGVAAYVAGFMYDVFRSSVAGVLAWIDFFLQGAAKAFGWIPGLGPKLQEAADNFGVFRDRVNNALDGIRNKRVVITAEFAGSAAAAARARAGDDSGYGGGRAAGGPVWPGQVYTWKEGGLQEGLMLTGGSGRVVSNQDMRAAQSGVGGEETIRVEVIVRGEDGQVIQEKLHRHKRQRGLTSLGLA